METLMGKQNCRARSGERKAHFNKTSTHARWKLLIKAVSNPEGAPKSLINACASQSHFAQFTFPEAGIYKLSLNTLKSCADSIVENGGWRELDNLRKTFRDLSEQKQSAHKSTTNHKKRQNDIYKELQNVIAGNYRVRAVLSLAYFDALRILRALSRNYPEIANQLNRHFAKYSNDLGIHIVKTKLEKLQ